LEGRELDEQIGSTLWREADIFEISATDEHNAFIDKVKGYKPGPEYKKIIVHFVYDIKHDGRTPCTSVAGGHLTETPIDSVYVEKCPYRELVSLPS
jgi:hypothetical protein